MIDKVKITNFKRFEEVKFDLQGRHVILAGPNNTGKTTVLQAIAAWGFGLNRWKELNDFNQRHGWSKAPITRQQFMPVSVRTFDLLWKDRKYEDRFEVHVTITGQTVGMEFSADSTEQIYVRPTAQTSRSTLETVKLDTVFVPAMTGLSVEETIYTQKKLEQYLGRNRPGEVLRNLLVVAYNRQTAWPRLVDSIRELFQVELLPPDDSGADIVAEFQPVGSRVRYDIASGGSGFQQVLMLLTFLNTRKESVLLLDEPDAHLHVFLQEAIFERLRLAAAESASQIIAATHSEVIIDSVALDELYVLMDQPLRLIEKTQRAALGTALRVIDNVDLMNARIARGILYVEDRTDLEILRAWAKVLKHPAQVVLGPQAYWRKTVADTGDGQPGIRARDHFDALQLVRPGFPALQIVDGDSRMTIPSDQVTGTRPPTTRWRRYEIESYLLHPVALERFVESQIGAAGFSRADREAMRSTLAKLLTNDFIEKPMEHHEPAEAVLETRKAREKLLPPVLSAAGLPAFPYTRYFEIAVQMSPEEVHPEVRQKLDMICVAFGVVLPGNAAPEVGAPS